MGRDAVRQVAERTTTPHEAAGSLLSPGGAGVRCANCNATTPPAAAGCPMCGRPRRAVCPCGEPADRELAVLPGLSAPRRRYDLTGYDSNTRMRVVSASMRFLRGATPIPAPSGTGISPSVIANSGTTMSSFQ